MLQSSILAYWTLRDQINDLYYHRVPVPFWDRHPGSGPQFVAAERVFIRLYTEETNLSMTAKQPPSYDGKVSWFRCEEGPLLKSRLTGDAYMYKAVLQNLFQDPDEGVNYFKNTLKKYFLKVYLYRLLSFFNHRSRTKSSSLFEILLMRLKAAWMDLMPVFTHHFDRPYRTQTQEQLLDISNQLVLGHRLQSCSMRMIPQTVNHGNAGQIAHFPSRIISLLIQSEVSDQQRKTDQRYVTEKHFTRELLL